MSPATLGLLVLAVAACRTVNADERQPAEETAATAPSPKDAPPAVGSATPLAASTPALAAAAPADAGAVDAGPPLTRHKHIVHVGDSTVGYGLGMQLELGKMLRRAGVTYDSKTVTAAGLHSFAKSKVVEQLIADKDPDLVIIQLGTNNLTVPNPAAYAPDVQDIVAQVGGRPCYWIGPIPLEQKEHGMRKMLRENVAPCVFYDSYDLKLARQPDKIHPTQPAAKKWADAFWKFTETAPL